MEEGQGGQWRCGRGCSWDCGSEGEGEQKGSGEQQAQGMGFSKGTKNGPEQGVAETITAVAAGIPRVTMRQEV